jgi:hypothetical protein
LSQAIVSTGLDMFVEIGDACCFGVVGSVVGVVCVVVVVEDVLGVFEHPEGVISGRPKADVDGASAVGLGQDAQSGLDVGGLVEDVSEDVGPGVAIAGHLHRPTGRQPDFLAQGDVF